MKYETIEPEIVESTVYADSGDAPSNFGYESPVISGSQQPLPDAGNESDFRVRYVPVSEAIASIKYPTVVADHIAQTAPLTSRVISAPPDELGGDRVLISCAAAIETIGASYPLRIGRLRELYGMLQHSETLRKLLSEQRESERQNLNRRNNEQNSKIDADLRRIEAEWTAERQRLNAAIADVEERCIAFRQAHEPAIELAVKEYLDLKAEAAARRDERDERQALRDEETQAALAIVEVEEDRRRKEARHQQRLLADERYERYAREREQEAVKLRADAEELAAKHAARQESEIGAEASAISGREERMSQALDAFEAALQTACEKTEALRAELERLAHEAAESFLPARREAQNRLSEAEENAHNELANLELAVSDAHRKAQVAAYRAGISMDDIHGSTHHADKLGRHHAAEECEDGHLDIELEKPHSWNWFVRGAGHLLNATMLIALGAVFGASLGLLLGAIDLSAEGIKRTDIAYVSVVICIGVFVFLVIGKATDQIARHAAKEAMKRQEKQYTAWIVPGLILVAFVAMEACVERFGLASVMENQIRDAGGTVSISTFQQVACWCLALVFSTPFVAYHAYHTAQETRNGIALRRRDETIATRIYSHFTHDLASDARGAYADWQAMLPLIDDVQQRHAARISDLNAALQRIETEIEVHPDVVRYREFLRSDLSDPHKDPSVIAARARLEEAAATYLEDPLCDSARRWRQIAEAEAEEAHQRAERANSLLREVLMDLGPRVSSEVGEVATGWVGSRLEAAVSSEKEPPITLPGIARKATGLALHRVYEQTNREVETWQEYAARHKMIMVKRGVSEHATLQAYHKQIDSLKSQIDSLDKHYYIRRKALRDELRAIDVRFTMEGGNRTSPQLDRFIEEAEKSALATRLEIDQEMLWLRELTEAPRLLAWYYSMRQRKQIRTLFAEKKQYAQALTIGPALPQRTHEEDSDVSGERSLSSPCTCSTVKRVTGFQS